MKFNGEEWGQLLDQIEVAFIGDDPPSISELIIRDGFDSFEKDDASEVFSTISWCQLVEKLENGEFGSAAVLLELWSVLSCKGIIYYFKAFIIYLLKTLKSDQPDLGFVSNFYFHLNNVANVYEGDIFSAEQLDVIKKVNIFVLHLEEKSSNIGDWDIWGSDIRSHMEKLIETLSIEQA